MADYSSLAQLLAQADQENAARNPYYQGRDLASSIGQQLLQAGVSQPETYSTGETAGAAALSGLLSGIFAGIGDERAATEGEAFRNFLLGTARGEKNQARPEGVSGPLYKRALDYSQLYQFANEQENKNVLRDLYAEVAKAGMVEQAKKEGEMEAYGGKTSILNPFLKEQRRIVDDLRKEFIKTPEYGDFSKAQVGFQTLLAAKDDPSRISDLDFIYGAIQMIEPGMAVKEGEQQAVVSSQSIPAELKGKMLAAMNGTALLEPDTREAIIDLASRRYEQYRSRYEALESGYKKRAVDTAGVSEGIVFLPNPGPADKLRSKATQPTLPTLGVLEKLPGESRADYIKRFKSNQGRTTRAPLG